MREDAVDMRGKRRPPWELVRAELDARDLSMFDVHDLVRESSCGSPIGHGEATALHELFGTSIDFWLDLQREWDNDPESRAAYLAECDRNASPSHCTCWLRDELMAERDRAIHVVRALACELVHALIKDPEDWETTAVEFVETWLLGDLEPEASRAEAERWIREG